LNTRTRIQHVRPDRRRSRDDGFDGALQPDPRAARAALDSDSGNTICAGIIKDSHPPAVFDDGRPSLRLAAYARTGINQSNDLVKSIQILRAAQSGSEDCSTGTPGPMVEDTDTFLR
jgi:hypothetical protein